MRHCDTQLNIRIPTAELDAIRDTARVIGKTTTQFIRDTMRAAVLRRQPKKDGAS